MEKWKIEERKRMIENDENNPNYILNITPTEVLIKIAIGEIDINQLVQDQLKNRGIDKSGAWVGFKESSKIWN